MVTAKTFHNEAKSKQSILLEVLHQFVAEKVANEIGGKSSGVGYRGIRNRVRRNLVLVKERKR